MVFGSQVLVFFGPQIFEISDFSRNLWGRYMVYLGDKCFFFSRRGGSQNQPTSDTLPES